MSKKNTTVKTATKKEKTPKSKKEKGVINMKAEVRLVSFTVGATIPTMMYGNILPSITVEAPTIEEAKAFALPIIEELYQTYLGEPQDGKLPKFINKANVTAIEKRVDPTPPAQPVAPAAKPKTPQESVDELAADLQDSPAFTKAQNAIKNVTDPQALELIEKQIQNSVKLTAAEKPVLLTEVLKKRKTFTDEL